MALGKGKRQGNGTAFFPAWAWNWLNIEEGEEYEFQDDTGKHGRFISFWKSKKNEDQV